MTQAISTITAQPSAQAPSLLQKVAWAVVNFSRRLSLLDPDGWSGTPNSRAGVNVNEGSVLGLSAAYACVNIHAGLVGSIPAGVYKRNRVGLPEEAWDHPLNLVIRSQPNAEDTALAFWEFAQASLELDGNAYAEKLIGAGGRVIGLRSLDPGGVAISRTPDGAKRYRWTERGISQSVLEDDIFHVPGFGYGGSRLKGLSTISACRQTFGLGIALDTAAQATFANGMRPGHALTFEQWLKPDQRETAETRLAEKFVGAINAGRPMVLEGGTKIETLSLSPEDAQMIESRKLSVEDICRIFGVPPVMVGHSNVTTWGTGVTEIVRGFVIVHLRKRVKRLEQQMTRQLLTAQERAAGYHISFNLEALLRGDPEKRVEFYQKMTMIGAMTINEVRAKEGLPPVPGGDVPRMQTQNQPIVMGTPATEITAPPPGLGDGG